MCGLWGVLAKESLTKEQLTLFQELGVVSTLRGYDSAGVALASRTKKKGFHYNWYKDVIPACNLVWEPGVTRAFEKAKTPLALMGHARWATIGSVTMENAHPFRTGDLLGMHNGTINSLKEKDKTDSEVLYERISKDGLEPTIADIKGQKAYALTWFDLRRNTFNVLRNYDRTLFYMRSGDSKLLVYASDDAFLKLITARYPHYKFGQPIPFEADHHYEFDVGDLIPVKVKIRDYIPVVSSFMRPQLPAANKNWKRELMEEMQAQEAQTRNEQPLNATLLKPGSTTGMSTSSGSIADSKIEVLPPNHRKSPPMVLSDEIPGVDHLTIDTPATLFRTKVKFLPWKVLLNKSIIKHLRYKMYDGSYGDPLVATTILAQGCAYSGVVATINDNVVWISPDAFVLEEHSDIPFVEECLIAGGFTAPVFGGPAYLSLAKSNILRLENKQKPQLPF